MNVYDSVDQMPEYVGGPGELIKYILKNAVYPDQEIAQGTVKLTLIIDADGSVKEEKILNKDINQYTPLDKEILRVVHLMPNWKPGKCNRKSVPVRVFIPIQLNR